MYILIAYFKVERAQILSRHVPYYVGASINFGDLWSGPYSVEHILECYCCNTSHPNIGRSDLSTDRFHIAAHLSDCFHPLYNLILFPCQVSSVKLH